MMTSVKHFLMFLFGAVYTSCWWIIIIKYGEMDKNTLSIFVAAMALMTFILLAVIIYFFVMNWKKK